MFICVSFLHLLHQILSRQSVTWPENFVVAHAGCIAAGVGRAFSHICLFVHAVKGKRLELSTPNVVYKLHIYSILVAGHALTQRSKVKVTRF